MTLHLICPACETPLEVPKTFRGRRIQCPSCASVVNVPTELLDEEPIDAEIVEEDSSQQESSWDIKFLDDLHGPRKVRQSLDPPTARTEEDSAIHIDLSATSSRQPSPEETDAAGAVTAPRVWLARMWDALLDPRSIQWLLTIGGGLMILGTLIWLISWGVFQYPLAAAIVLGAISLGTLGAGCGITLKSRYKLAGRALGFLGCVFVSLNLWFYHAQGLLLLEHGLWMAGVVCVLIYIATVWVLRDPVYLYAVEVGITLTSILLLGDLGVANHATPLSILLMVLALISIHAHRVFPGKAEYFDEKRFGMPLFWCGHMQLLGAVVVLLGSQIAGTLQAAATLVGLPVDGILLTNTRFAPGMLWLAAAYAYLYSDLAVRKIGLYVYFAAVCLVMAEATLIGFDTLGAEGLMATLAATATAISLVTLAAPPAEKRLARTVAPLAILLGAVPVLIGLFVHLRATSTIAAELGLAYVTSWTFVGATLLVAALNRVTAFAYQQRSAGLAAVHLCYTAAALVVAAAGGLRMLDVVTWQAQTAWLMWIAIGYLIAARLWKGKSPERPLAYVAHVITAVILLHVFRGVVSQIAMGLDPQFHLAMVIVLAEVTLFYGLAAVLRGQALNLYAANSAGCAAIWQAMLYWSWPHETFAAAFAFAGLLLVVVARFLGVQTTSVYSVNGRERKIVGGRGVSLIRTGNGILSIALLVAIMQGMSALAAVGISEKQLTGLDWSIFGLVTFFALVGAGVSVESMWRRLYVVAAICMGGLTFLAFNIALDISAWRKMEVFLVTIGLFMLVFSYVGRFREESEDKPDETVSLGLWLGSILASIPLVIAVFANWSFYDDFSFQDEVVLIAITLLMTATGVVWRVKASTLFGGGVLFIYLCALVISLTFRPQVAIGVYLTIGGAVLFALGLLLAAKRDRLVSLPQRVANREGVFEFITWR